MGISGYFLKFDDKMWISLLIVVDVIVDIITVYQLFRISTCFNSIFNLILRLTFIKEFEFEKILKFLIKFSIVNI